MTHASRASRLIVIVGFDGAQLLDITGPLQVFASACELMARSRANGGRQAKPPYEIVLASPEGGLLRTSSGVSLRSSSLRALRRRRYEIDTLIIAGGPAEALTAARRDKALIAWVRSLSHRVRRLCSVCTGAFVLAETGALEGRRVVTHWASCGRLAELHPAVKVESNPIFVHDGPIWTSAGVTSGIDLALALVEEDLGGGVALSVARWLVVFLKRPGGQAQFSTPLEAQMATAEHDVAPRLSALHAWMAENLADNLTVEKLAKRVGMSRRTFARVYSAATGTTPAKAVEAMRVEAARRALESDEPVKSVAATCGFGDYERLRRAFQRRLRVSPQLYQAGFKTSAKTSGSDSDGP
jgi:transcriptional regulator GlxA family with amidase domain